MVRIVWPGAVLLSVVVLVLGACAPPEISDLDHELADAAAAAVREGDLVVLADVEPSSWDEVAIFGPYGSHPEATGMPDIPRRAERRLVSDSDQLVVFLDQDEVVSWHLSERNRVDLVPSAGRYTRAEAVFVADEEPETGMIFLSPSDRPAWRPGG